MKYSIAILLSLLFISSQGQTFEIICKTKIYNNKKLVVSPAVLDTSYYPNKLFASSQNDIINVLVNNGRFSVKGETSYPVPIQFSYLIEEAGRRRVTASDFLFVSSGQLDVELEDFTTTKKVIVSPLTKEQEEYQNLRELYRHLEIENGMQRIVPFEYLPEKYRIIKEFVEKNPGAYSPLWILINDFATRNYRQAIDSILPLFSGNIRTSKAFKTFAAKLWSEKRMALGAYFPCDTFSFNGQLSNVISTSRFTLIDFWASYCKPCIAKFPELKEIHDKYKRDEFSVVTISIDNQQNKPQMKAILQRFGINWNNINDEDGFESMKLNITGIPRNFLLDSKGKIILKDVSSGQLRKFLTEHISVK